MNPFPAIGHYFAELGKALFGQFKVTLVAFLHQFAAEDLGKLAIDAVTYAAGLKLGSNDETKAAAKEKLIDDLKAAGHDIVQFGESTYNFLLETGLQKVKADAGQGIVALQ